MEIEILNATSSRSIGKCNVPREATVADLKAKVHQLNKKLNPNRQSIRLESRGKQLNDSVTLSSVNLQSGSKVYVKDLGPQVSWSGVFLCEYAGPLIVYLWVYQRPWIFYGTTNAPYSQAAHIAAACWTVHYAKRLLETIFVHRFSHATMPLRNLFKNCAYYWGFTAYVAYHVCHPLFTSPSQIQVYAGLATFILCELGNLSIHVSLRNLRPPGTKIRKIPKPDSNPLTGLFNLVSCPNYTYEFGAWFGFSVLTQCLPAFIFALVGIAQMSVWAIAKHKNYRKEFPDYPKGRKAILPFIL